MIKNFRIFIYLLISSFFSLSGICQTTWVPKIINSEDGLSNSAITKIFMASNGAVWFGTWDGLNYYNGIDIKVFKPDVYNENSISNNIIRDIFESDNGDMWVVTDEGINRFNPNTMGFQSYFTNIENLAQKEYSLKACVVNDNFVLVSLYGLGLSYFNKDINEFDLFNLRGIKEIEQKNIVGLYSRGDSIFYFITEKGNIYAYDVKEGTPKIYDVALGHHTELQFDKNWFVEVDNSPWLAIAIKSGGLYLFNLSTHASFHVLEGTQSVVTAVNESIEQHVLWLGTDDGVVYKVDLKSGLKVQRMDKSIHNLATDKVKIWTINQTSDDLLWIGTDGQGVFQYITKGKPFYNVKKGDGPGTINHNIVRAISKDKEGNLWVGTRGSGLNMLPIDGSDTKYLNIENGLSNNAVLSLDFDDKQNLWIGTDGEGIDMLEKSSGRIFHFPKDFNNPVDLNFGHVYSICFDVYGEIWCGTSGYGLINLNISRNEDGTYSLNSYRQFDSGLGEEDLQCDIVYSIIEERANILWVGTRGGGLYRLNTVKNTFDSYKELKSNSIGLINDDVLSLCLAKDGKLWVGTSGGLTSINLEFKPWQFKHYTEHNGLSNNTLHGILEDAEGNIWLSTNSGLSKFLVAEELFINFNKTDGLQNNEYTDGSFCNDKKNNLLYFGGVNGVDWFNPQQIKQSNKFARIVFDEFRLYNIPVTPSDSSQILSNSLDKTNKIELKYNQNFFSLSFLILNYFNSSKCEYAYKLEGFDQDWNYIKNQRTAVFTNVPPGQYKFKVKATNEDGIWSSEIREISIVINPPFWNTIYAYLAYALFMCVLFMLLVFSVKRRSRVKRQIEIEKINRQKQEEINQYKLRFFTNIAHEFRTPLTLILAPAVSLMKYAENDDHLSKFAGSIYQNAKRLQRLIYELIEFRKVETGNMALEVRKCELVEYVGELVNAFEHFAMQNEISLRFIHSKSLITGWVDVSKLEKILLNLLSNAIKYTPKGGFVEVELESHDENIVFMVRDSGIGIPKAVQEKIFDRFFHHVNTLPQLNISQEGTGVGLSLTKSLIELHKGVINVESKEGEGSVFKFTLPARKKYYENNIIEEDYDVKPENIVKKVAEEFQIPIDYKLDDINKRNINKEKKYTILVVDDNVQICNLISSLLVDDFYLHTAFNGSEALEILDNEKIDLVINDVIMPKVDGLQLCDQIKSNINTSHIPVILLTARGDAEQRIEGFEAGADSYIPKPFHPGHLLARVRQLLEAGERLRNAFKVSEEHPPIEVLQKFSPKDQKLMSALNEFIEDNLESALLNADNLSAHLGMSKAQLYRKIKVLTDMTPHGLIKHIRLKKAAFLLKQSDKTVSEVFYETGFNNRTYFYRSFKEAYGVTPGEYTARFR